MPPAPKVKTDKAGLDAPGVDFSALDHADDASGQTVEVGLLLFLEPSVDPTNRPDLLPDHPLAGEHKKKQHARCSCSPGGHMGCSYMSHAVIGVRVFYDDVFENRVVKAFEHDYPAGWKLDPQTGKPLWTEERVLKPGFQWDKYEDEVEKCMGFNVVQSATNERLRRRDVYFIALAHTKDQERYDDTPVGTLAPFDLTALAKNFIPFYNAMNSIGLWRPDNFGLWSYQYISC